MMPRTGVPRRRGRLRPRPPLAGFAQRDEGRRVTIVEYTDKAPAVNHYPRRIVSPSRSSPCCFSGMADVGGPRRDGRWEFRYRRCQTCGFTVRFVTRTLPDEELLRDLRPEWKTCFGRRRAA